MSIPKFFQSTDAGAPALTGSVGSLNAVLKACLVNGYGEKASAGWELVFENQTNNQLVLKSRSLEGGQCCYSFNNSNVNYTIIQGYEDWIDSNSNRYIIHRSEGRFNGQNRWILVADEKSCWLIVMATASSLTCVPVFFGDFKGFNEIEVNSVIIAPGSTTYASSSSSMTSLSNKGHLALAPNGMFTTLGSGSTKEYSGFGNSSSNGINEVVIGQNGFRVFQPVKLFTSLNSIDWHLSGFLPGYLYCDVSTEPQFMLVEHTGIKGLPGQTVIEFKAAWGGTHFINISEW